MNAALAGKYFMTDLFPALRIYSGISGSTGAAPGLFKWEDRPAIPILESPSAVEPTRMCELLVGLPAVNVLGVDPLSPRHDPHDREADH